MCLFYFVSTLVDTLRVIFGPMPRTICTLTIFIKNFVYINMAQFSLAQTVIKFLCVCIYKSIPTMEDDFLFVFLCTLFNIISFLAVGIRMYLPGKPILQEVT